MSTITELGPRQMGLLAFLARFGAGLGGGVFGSVILLLIIFGASSSFAQIAQEGFTEVTPFFIFVFMIGIFLASLGTNVMGCLFIGLADRGKYHHLASVILQIFALNLFIFLLLSPFYILMTNINPQTMILLAALQSIISALGSFLILEIVANTNYALLGVYSAILSSLTGSLIAILIFRVTGQNIMMLMLISLPMLWGMLGLFSGLFEMGYYALYELYGIDFLRADTRFGRDVPLVAEDSKVTQEDERLLLKNQEEGVGTEFLKKKTK